MVEFIRKHASVVTGVLSGFDRVLIRGTFRNLIMGSGIELYLSVNKILFKDAGAHFGAVSEKVKLACEEVARQHNRPVLYLPLPKESKEEIVRKMAPRKCLHVYNDYLHPQFGLMHTRLQTWFPFTMTVCINGREWLGRQMDAAGLKYLKADNCFLELEDVARAQALADAQLKTDWVELLQGRAGKVTRLLRMLRAHGLLKKVPKTHRYHLTENGREVVVALNAAKHAGTKKLTQMAA